MISSHRQLTFALIISCASMQLLSACKTAGEAASADAQYVPGEQDGPIDETTGVPLSLWSPAQRRASAGFYFMVAETVALKERDPKKALPIYEAAYNLDPNSYLGGKLIAAKAAVGDRGEALLDARKMVLLYPKESHLRFLYGQLLAVTDQTNEAIVQLERCIQMDPTFEEAYLELIDIYQKAQETPRAIVVAKDLVKKVSSSVTGWSQLSRLYLVNNQYKEALLPAQRAWEMQSANPNLTQVYAVVLQLNGKSKQAIQIYEQLYRMNPTDEELTARMVELYRELGNLEDALGLLDELIRVGGESKVGVQMQKAILLWELKRFGEASALLDQLAKEHPESDRLRYMAALGQEKLKNYDEALRIYDSLPEESSFRYQGQLRIVVILQEQKKYNEAIERGNLVIKDKRVEWEAFGLLGNIYADAQRYEDAVDVLTVGYKKFPQQSRLLFLLGVYQEKAGDLDGCIDSMRQVIAKDPQNSSAYNYLGYLFAEKKENLEEAESLIKRALQLKPDDGFYLDSLGWVYFQKGDYKNAQPILEKAVAKEPKEGAIIEHLADLFKAKGELDKALKAYEQALQCTLEAKERTRIEQKVKEIKGNKVEGG
jgi:tetratricopeptide (TPR) repeat protein